MNTESTKLTALSSRAEGLTSEIDTNINKEKSTHIRGGGMTNCVNIRMVGKELSSPLLVGRSPADLQMYERE